MKWSLETWKIGDIHENENNPRLLSKKQATHLRDSIRQFGVCEPLVVNRDGRLIGGHQRRKILESLGRSNAPVYIPDRMLTEEEAKELTIRLNKNVGQWDYDVLANSWDADLLVEWGFSLEELGMGDPLEAEDKPYKATVTISVDDEVTLLQLESEVREMLLHYLDVDYKVKVKG